jgi:hypothetical protein
MEELGSQVLPAANHIRFLIFDWSVPNLVIGLVIVVLFFLAAWLRLPGWIEGGRGKTPAGRRKK